MENNVSGLVGLGLTADDAKLITTHSTVEVLRNIVPRETEKYIAPQAFIKNKTVIFC